MKKTLVILSSLLVLFSCAKEQAVIDHETEGAASAAQTGNLTTIRASIPEGGLTKVSMEQDALNPDGAIKLAWEAEDVLTVTDSAEPANSVTFTLQSGAGEKDATFTGTTPSGWTGPFKVSYSSAGKSYNYNVQTQAADGSTEHLKYVATLNGVTDLEHFAFSKDWADAHSATLSSSSVLRIRVQMPDGVAAKVKSMTLKTPAAPGAMVLNLATPSDAEGDGILNLYMTIPAGDIALPEGMPVALAFSTDDADCFTRIHIFTAESNFLSGRVNALKFNCKSLVNSASEIIVPGDGSSACPYLIGDKFQLCALALLMTDDVTTYVKMVDDVDMKDVTWTHLNAGTDYKQYVNFDGNNKTISNLSKDLFYVFKGSVKDLTLDQSVVTARGILAEYIQGTGHSISNVHITNGSVTSSSSNVGAMIGRINNGTAGTASVTISGCTVSKTNVTGASIVGGVIGFAEAMVNVSDVKYTGGTVTSSGQYVGGFVGSVGNENSTITNCQVEDATINANHTADARCGGFVGMLQDSATASGCTVGTPEKKVIINTKEPSIKSGTTYNVINAGGFVGVCYGKITKNGDVRSKAYVKITSTNTQGTPLKIGGFVGYHSGTIEYSDAVADMTSIKGQHIGGFAGYVVPGAGVRYANIDNCTAAGDITGNNFTAGFIGYADKGSYTISNCTASGTMSGQSGCGGFVGDILGGTFTNNSTSVTVSCSGSNNGGFVGRIYGGSLSNCTASGSVTSTSSGTSFGGFCGLVADSTTIDKCSSSGDVKSNGKSYFAGFIAAINNGTVVITRCFSTGNVTCDQTYVGGFISNIHHASNTLNVTIENCYSTGDIIESNQMRGGLIGQIATVTSATISNCYATGAVVGAFRLGGLIGNVGSSKITVRNCAAWNSEVTASDIADNKWSTGAVVGTAFPTCTLTDNYRKSDMPVKSIWGNVTGYKWELAADYQHPDVSASSPLIVCDKTKDELTLKTTSATALASGQDNYPIYPYHGKVASGKTLSQLASTTLGWSADIWDFTGDLPKLK